MALAEYLEIAEKLWENGSFLPFFYGTAGCEPLLLRHVPACVPTDWFYVIEHGIYALYRKEKDEEIAHLCRRDVEYLLDSEEAFSVWCGYNVCFSLIYDERGGKAPFRLMDGRMLDKLRGSLAVNRERLRAARIWQGANAPDGLWSDIERSAKVLEKKFAVRLLDMADGTAPKPETKRAAGAWLRGKPAPDVAALLGRKLREYADAIWQKEKELPCAVRIQGMDVPHVDAEYGDFGFWRPEPAHAAASPEALEQIYGVRINPELYDYYRGWRFAALELEAGTLILSLNPLYENAAGQTNFFFSVLLEQELYFKLGTAVDKISGIEYTLLFKHSGGIWLLEDGGTASEMLYFSESITALLENTEFCL